jgi:hypothetical protein
MFASYFGAAMLTLLPAPRKWDPLRAAMNCCSSRITWFSGRTLSPS